ncbi:hypothetical protein DVH24_000972 [Malus domestica]|uniref:Uncharacterized protein n=1 Tax=Malus domestica TaxID=3750 RepID=A0A498K0C7_MALDO|nr:hypothetical protein DVH24_000972 [Malus domestica]
MKPSLSSRAPVSPNRSLRRPEADWFLGRAEFYNALRVVTVAQSKRELTPETVKVALYGLGAAKIPAPKINLETNPAPQFNSAAAAAALDFQGGAVTLTSLRNLGFRLSRQPMPIAPSHDEEMRQLSTEEVNSLNSKFKEATEANKKLVTQQADIKMPLDL